MSAGAIGLMTGDVMIACSQEDAHLLGVGHKHETLSCLAADFLFVAGKHWKVLVLLMVHTGMVGMVVCGGDKERDVQSTAAVFNEIGVGGL